jgi:endonuclease YncB( thermonuclease family)
VQTLDRRRVTIRLQGIDAPERTMAYSQISRRHLHELVMGKVVTFDPEKLDRHGRTVAVVRLQDGTDVCLKQIEAGLAWHFKRYELEQSREDRAAYAAAEVIAKAARRGVWRDDSPVPPWEFRASNSKQHEPVH